VGGGKVARLYPDYRAEEMQYHTATGIYPIMHVVAMRRVLFERYPWVAMNLFKAFEEAKQRSLERIQDLTASRLPVPWSASIAAELSKNFGAVTAANDINARIEQDSVVGLIGSNGAGKTTFINMVTGYLKPSAGQVLYRERDITGLPPRQVTTLGICRTFQNIRLFGSMSVLDNVKVAFDCRQATTLTTAILRTPAHRDLTADIVKACSPASRSSSCSSGRTPTPTGSPAPASPSTTAWCVTRRCSLRPVSCARAMSRGGPTRSSTTS
jgi:hypothetical protein